MTHRIHRLPTLALLLAALIAPLALGGCASGSAPGAATPAAGPAPDEPIFLRWSWNEGDVVRYRHTTDTDSTIVAEKLFEEPMTTHARQVAEFTQRVESVSPDGVATLRMIYDRVEMTSRQPGEEDVHWSSDEPAPEGEEMQEVAGLMGALVGQAFTLQVDEYGDVLGVDGLDELIDSIGASLDDEARAMFDQTMAEMLSEETLLELVGQGLVELPAHPVEVGDSWTLQSTYTVPVVGSMTQTRVYRVERIDAGEALLALDGDFGSSPDEAGAEALPLPPEIAEMMDFRLEVHRGGFDGTVRFDREDGLVAHQETTADLEMTLVMTPKGELATSLPEPIEMEMSVVARTIQERID